MAGMILNADRLSSNAAQVVSVPAHEMPDPTIEPPPDEATFPDPPTRTLLGNC